MKKSRILIVEDENLVARDLHNMVRTIGYEITDVVQTGEEVFASVNRKRPDLVLMDIVLRGKLDGISVAAVLWEEYSIPVVYITSFADDLTFERAKLTEPFGYLIKPFDERELELTIETALYKARMQLLLKEKEQWLSTILKSIGDGIIAVNSSGTVSFINGQAQKITGWTEQEALGKKLEEIFLLKNNLPGKNGRSLTVNATTEEVILVARNGQEISIEMTSSPIPESTGTGSGRVIVFRDISARKQAEQEIEESRLRLQRALKGTIQAISTMVEMRDPYTAGHQRRVAKLAEAIGRELGMSEAQLEGLKLSAEIHDIGKIYVPSEILSKPTKLTELEYTIIKTHSQAGYEILVNIEFPWPVAEIVYQHHERIDGSGYPRGLKGEEILPEARILAVADVVEAMASHRPYRPAFGIDRALEEIKLNRGRLYGSDEVDACVRLIEEKGFSLD
ncbi:MAG: HD domain-containing phosphohydrolase [Candidatus Saccharicenans sp.]